MLVHQGKKAYSAVTSCVTLEIVNLASAVALQWGGVDNGRHWWSWRRNTLQGEGGNGPWMIRVRVNNSGGRARFTEGRGVDWLPLSVKFGARCWDPMFLMWTQKMEDGWPTPLSLFAIFLKQNNSPCFSWRCHPAREVLFESRHCQHMVCSRSALGRWGYGMKQGRMGMGCVGDGLEPAICCDSSIRNVALRTYTYIWGP